MNCEASRTLVGSVLFIDIVGYSKKGVVEQVELKRTFNAVLAGAMEQVPPRERVIVDTGDGAAATFLGDPEGALFVALAVLDRVGELPVRMGINLGPVSLITDINGHDNVVGDGINVAQRVMSFAGEGQLLVSRSFYEVVSLLSKDYMELFRPEPARRDKHDRAHELYAVVDAVRIGRRVLQAQVRLRAQRPRVPPVESATPVQVFDAGSHFVVSGPSPAAVQQAIEKLTAQGSKVLSPVTPVGRKWVASVDNPALAVPASVEALGFKRIVTASTREAVLLSVRELLAHGARVVQEPEFADGVWVAVCDRT